MVLGCKMAIRAEISVTNQCSCKAWPPLAMAVPFVFIGVLTQRLGGPLREDLMQLESWANRSVGESCG